VHARRKSRLFVATAFQEALQKQCVPHDGVEGSGVYLREVFHRSRTPMAVSVPAST
jgi:small subunit ribosomal protein S5